VLLDAIMDTYLANKRGRKNQTTDEATSAITEEISRLDAEIRNDEQELLDFQKQNNVVFIEEQSTSSAAYLVGLNDELAKLIKERDLLSLENKDPLLGANYDRNTKGISAQDIDAVSESTPPSPTSPVPGSTTTDNRANETNPIIIQQDRIETSKINRDQLGVYLKDKHPKMIKLADDIEQMQKFLEMLMKRDSTQRNATREDLELQIKNLKQQIEVSNTNSLKLSESLATYQELKNKINREQDDYNKLAMSIQNVHVNKSLDQEDVVILEAASTASPIVPDNILGLVFGFSGGLIPGVALVYFVSRLDDKIDSTAQLEENFDLPILGQIPRVSADKQTKRVALLGESDPRHEFLEYHRNLRSVILFQSAEATKLGSLMICSAAPGEGKSTLAADLAIVFAHTGLRVLLIDADLRRGILDTFFDLPETPGLSNYLRGEISWPEIVQETKVANLNLIPRGKFVDRTGDLLVGSATDLLFQESPAAFDIVLWDSAPLLASNDAANLCSKVDGILFVARVRRSTVRTVRSALEDLSQRNAKILGFVLNAVEYQKPGYSGKYRYKEYYETTANS
jgi:capsular exopolysaccharide synthesis family protein